MRRAFAVAAATATAVALGWAARRRASALAPVAQDLRSPALWVPVSVGGQLSLALARRAKEPSKPDLNGVHVAHRMVPGPDAQDVLDVITVEPTNRRGPTGAVLWMHGGGFVMGAPESELAAAGTLARELGAIVALPRYRLAPEHPFPAALDDCLAALKWLHTDAIELGIDRNRIALLGISAGGGLAASLAQRNRDGAQLPLAAQVLVYPMLDDRTVLRADDQGRGRLVWTARSNRFAWRSYLGGPPGHRDLRPWAVPGRCDNLAGLPPAWIGVGDLDLFYEEDVDYANRLAAAGGDVELLVVPGMYHAANKFAPESAESLQGLHQSLVETLRRAIC